MIEILNASYSAGGKQILRAANWSIFPGQRWAVLGPNGAGKTTLLRIAGGYIWPNRGGTVHRLGEELVDLRELRRSIGWVANTLAVKVPGNERVRDTVVSGAIAQLGLTHQRGFEPSEVQYEQADAALASLNLTHLVDRPFGVLSQGEQQAVLVARATMAQPMLMVLDEPCAGLDPGAREEFLSRLGELLERHESLSVVFVTHHIEEIIPALDQLLVVQQGQITSSGKTDELLSAELLATLYRAPRPRIEQSGGRYWPIW